MIVTAATPAGLRDEALLAWFASKLRALPLKLRCTVATPTMFRLLSSILAMTPPPQLVDAICTAMDAALRQPALFDKRYGVLVRKEAVSAYAKEVCTAALRQTLCDLVALGPLYASSALLRMVWYVADSAEFKSLSERDSAMLVRLCAADTQCAVVLKAQTLHAQRLLADYAKLPFPKPDFPLGEECVQTSDCHFSG
jgi:hypothetical protein